MPVHAATVPPGGKWLLTIDATGTITAWTLEGGRRLYSQPALPASELPQRMTCSPDGRLVALSARTAPSTIVRDGSALLWRMPPKE